MGSSLCELKCHVLAALVLLTLLGGYNMVEVFGQQTTTNFTQLFLQEPNVPQAPSSPNAVGFFGLGAIFDGTANTAVSPTGAEVVGVFGFDPLVNTLPNTRASPTNPAAQGVFGFQPLFPKLDNAPNTQLLGGQTAIGEPLPGSPQVLGGSPGGGASLQGGGTGSPAGGGGVSLGGESGGSWLGIIYVSLLLAAASAMIIWGRRRG